MRLKNTVTKSNTMNKVKEYIDSLNQMIKDNRELTVNLTLDPNKQIENKTERCLFSGDLFLRKIYYQLSIDKLCGNI